MLSLTHAQAAELSRLLAEEGGVPPGEQVARAGAALAEVARRLLGGAVVGRSMVVAAGPGNKGAAGIVAARTLHEWGAAVRLILSVPVERLHPLAAAQLAEAEGWGLKAWGLGLSDEEMTALTPIHWAEADLLVDALLGSGLDGDPRGEAADLIQLLPTVRRPILSLDLPSGVSGDEGYILSPCIEATATLALGLPRRALLEAWPVAGTLWLADLGIPPALYAHLGSESPDFGGESVLYLGRVKWET